MKYETKVYTRYNAYTSYSHLDEWEAKGIQDSCYDDIPDDVEGVQVLNDRDGFIPPISEEWEHSKKTDWYTHVPTGIKVKLESQSTPDYHKVGGHGSCTTTLTVKIPLPDGRGSNPNSHHNKKKIEGVSKLIKLSEEQWEKVKQIGNGNYSQGIRKLIK